MPKNPTAAPSGEYTPNFISDQYATLASDAILQSTNPDLVEQAGILGEQARGTFALPIANIAIAEVIGHVEHGRLEAIRKNEATAAKITAQFSGRELPIAAQKAIDSMGQYNADAIASIPATVDYEMRKHLKNVAQTAADQAKETRISARLEAAPWDVPEATVSVAARNYLQQTFENWKKGEALPGKPNEKIHVPKSRVTDPADAALLTAAGMSEEQITAGQFTRQELLDAGVFFLNRIGGGEKGIINAAIPDPSDPNKVLDFSNRRFLTRAELETVYDFQQQNGDGLQGHDAQKVQADMMLFVTSMLSPAPFKSSNELGAALVPDSIDGEAWIEGSADEHQTVMDKYGAFEKSDLFLADAASSVGQLYIPTQRAVNGGGMATMMGHRVVGRNGVSGGALYERYDKLEGSPSPFLTSGFHFSGNPDVLLTTGEDVVQRFNAVNIHLVGGHPDFPGLSEMGQADWDQQYMTTGEYVKEFYPESNRQEVEAADSGRREGQLTARERVQAIDMLFLDSADLKRHMIANGQQQLIKKATAVEPFA